MFSPTKTPQSNSSTSPLSLSMSSSLLLDYNNILSSSLYTRHISLFNCIWQNGQHGYCIEDINTITHLLTLALEKLGSFEFDSSLCSEYLSGILKLANLFSKPLQEKYSGQFQQNKNILLPICQLLDKLWFYSTSSLAEDIIIEPMKCVIDIVKSLICQKYFNFSVLIESNLFTSITKAFYRLNSSESINNPINTSIANQLLLDLFMNISSTVSKDTFRNNFTSFFVSQPFVDCLLHILETNLNNFRSNLVSCCIELLWNLLELCIGDREEYCCIGGIASAKFIRVLILLFEYSCAEGYRLIDKEFRNTILTILILYAKHNQNHKYFLPQENINFLINYTQLNTNNLSEYVKSNENIDLEMKFLLFSLLSELSYYSEIGIIIKESQLLNNLLNYIKSSAPNLLWNRAELLELQTETFLTLIKILPNSCTEKFVVELNGLNEIVEFIKQTKMVAVGDILYEAQLKRLLLLSLRTLSIITSHHSNNNIQNVSDILSILFSLYSDSSFSCNIRNSSLESIIHLLYNNSSSQQIFINLSGFSYLLTQLNNYNFITIFQAKHTHFLSNNYELLYQIIRSNNKNVELFVLLNGVNIVLYNLCLIQFDLRKQALSLLAHLLSVNNECHNDLFNWRSPINIPKPQLFQHNQFISVNNSCLDNIHNMPFNSLDLLLGFWLPNSSINTLSEHSNNNIQYANSLKFPLYCIFNSLGFEKYFVNANKQQLLLLKEISYYASTQICNEWVELGEKYKNIATNNDKNVIKTKSEQLEEIQNKLKEYSLNCVNDDSSNEYSDLNLYLASISSQIAEQILTLKTNKRIQKLKIHGNQIRRKYQENTDNENTLNLDINKTNENNIEDENELESERNDYIASENEEEEDQIIQLEQSNNNIGNNNNNHSIPSNTTNSSDYLTNSVFSDHSTDAVFKSAQPTIV